MTKIAVAPPQVALEPAVVVPKDIERNRKLIFTGVAPLGKPSADKKKQRASIVSQLATDCNAFKQSLRDGRSNHYGADKRVLRHVVPFIEIVLRLTPYKNSKATVPQGKEGPCIHYGRCSPCLNNNQHEVQCDKG